MLGAYWEDWIQWQILFSTPLHKQAHVLFIFDSEDSSLSQGTIMVIVLLVMFALMAMMSQKKVNKKNVSKMEWESDWIYGLFFKPLLF